VRIARNAIKRRLKLKVEEVRIEDPILKKYGMAFVTLETSMGG